MTACTPPRVVCARQFAVCVPLSAPQRASASPPKCVFARRPSVFSHALRACVRVCVNACLPTTTTTTTFLLCVVSATCHRHCHCHCRFPPLTLVASCASGGGCCPSSAPSPQLAAAKREKRSCKGGSWPPPRRRPRPRADACAQPRGTRRRGAATGDPPCVCAWKCANVPMRVLGWCWCVATQRTKHRPATPRVQGGRGARRRPLRSADGAPSIKCGYNGRE
jgi:hypothetical protein